MTGLITLDIAIGLVFTLLLFSLFATAIQEAIASLLRWRSAALRMAVRNMLGQKFDDFWGQPLIETLKGPQFSFFRFRRRAVTDRDRVAKRDPSYLQPEIFAKALLTYLETELQLRLGDRSPKDIARALHERIEWGSATHIESRLYAVLVGIEGDAAKAEQAVAEWFDDVMKRVTGWYVRRTQFVLFLIGLAMAVVTNTDLVNYARELARNDELRQAVATKAAEVAALENLDDVRDHLNLPRTAAPEDAQTIKAVDEAIKERLATLATELDQIQAQSGWDHCRRYDTAAPAGISLRCVGWTTGLWEAFPTDNQTRPPDVPNPLLGWLLLAFGVMLGSQFWFDVLKRFVSLRAAVTSALGAVRGKRERSEN